MKNKKLLFLVSILAVVAIGLVVVNQKSLLPNVLQVIPTVTPVPTITVKQQTVLVAVSKFTNLKTNYTFAELKKQNLITLKANQEFIPQMLTVNTVSKNQLTQSLDDGAIAILTPEQVMPWYKTLLIDGQNVWSKDFSFEKYRLAHELSVDTADLSAVDQINLSKDYKTVVFSSGEIIPARAVDRLSLNVFNNYTYLFDFFKNDIKNADLAVAMLENSLLGNPSPCTGCTNFVGDDQAAKGIAKVGFDIISTAGNHAGDGGQAAIANTLEQFKMVDVQTTGTGKTKDQNLQPAISKVGDLRVGVIGADDIAYFYWDAITNDQTFGTNSFSKISNSTTVVDYDRVAELKKIKTANKIDFLIVFMSWGVEYTNKPTSHQQELGHALIDNGVDMVLGSHPHWVQAVEFYQQKPIVYSMGNFIFDQTHTLQTRQGMVANFYFYDNQLKSIELIPHLTCGYHQTSNNLTQKYLAKELTLQEVYDTKDTSGCVYWQPKKLDESIPDYQQILERVFEYSKI